MLQTINMNLFKENPQIFFKQLPKEAEVEFSEFLRIFLIKYNISYPKVEYDKKLKFKNFIENPILISKTIKYTREDLHER